MAWLVTGGAGYIGAHVVRAFIAAGIDPIVVDNLSSGHRSFVPDGVPCHIVSVTDEDALRDVFEATPVEGVVHLAGYKYAGESVAQPLTTFEQNVAGTVTLLRVMESAGVRNLVFSSSAAVYGTPTHDVVTESTDTKPESPYGESKLIGEWIIRDQARATGLRHTSLRYFNVVGSGTNDVCDTSPHNLFPRVFNALTSGENPVVFGTDYPTPDGTCVRDYVHVSDIAASHVVAARRLAAEIDCNPVYNLGSGSGTSVGDIMSAMARVTGIDFEPERRDRRPGDPARIVANGDLAARDLEWAQRHTIDDMVASAWSAHTAFINDRRV